MLPDAAFAATDGDDLGLTTKGIGNATLPTHPGMFAARHLCVAYAESVIKILAGRGLLEPARGRSTLRASDLVDFPLNRLPVPSLGDPQYAKLLELRTKWEMHNEKNTRVRTVRTMEDYTLIYVLVSASLEVNCPVQAKQLEAACNFYTRNESSVEGYYDGPLAFAASMGLLNLEENVGGDRPKTDSDFYEKALSAQLAHPLPDGCAAEEYMKRAGHFMYQISPHLLREFKPLDASNHLIRLLPQSMREAGRRIKKELEAAGSFLDQMAVSRECRKVIAEEQKSGAPTPAFVTLMPNEYNPYNPADLASLAGFTLAPDSAFVVRPPGGGRPYGGGGKPPGGNGGGAEGNCDWCGQEANHGRPAGLLGPDKCAMNPARGGKWPVSLYINPEKKAATEKARLTNSKKPGVKPLVHMEPPSEADIKKFKERVAAREKARAAKKPGPNAGGVAGGSSFMAGLLDVADDFMGFAATDHSDRRLCGLWL